MDCGLQRLMIVFLKRIQAMNGEPWISIHAMDSQMAENFWFGCGGASCDAVVRGEHVDFVAERAESFADIPAADFVAADFVGRIEIRDDEDFHASRL